MESKRNETFGIVIFQPNVIQETWTLLQAMPEAVTMVEGAPWARPLPRGPPGGPPMAIFCYMVSFNEEKIISHLLGRNSAATRRNLGGTNLGLRQSCSAGETSLWEGEIIAIVITNSPLIRRVQSPSTSSPAPSPLKTLVHLLYPILYQNHKLVHVGC